MNPHIGSSTLILTVLFTVFPVVGADYAVHVVDPPITNQSIATDKPLPQACKPGSVLEVRACRLVREPESNTVALYIDNHPKPALQLSPARCDQPACDENDLNWVQWGNSVFQGRWDFFRYHQGATTP